MISYAVFCLKKKTKDSTQRKIKPKKIMKEFEIDKNITLRLEEGKTIIYIDNKEFKQCKYLFLINPNKTIGRNFN